MYHVAINSHLDDQKYKINSPKQITRSYQQLLATGLFPSPKRIEQDVRKVMKSMLEVLKNHSTIVPGLGDRSGKQGEGTRTYSNWSSHCVKGSGIKYDELKTLAPNARAAYDKWVAATSTIKEKFNECDNPVELFESEVVVDCVEIEETWEEANAYVD